MAYRPTDWHVLDLDGDPTPGDPDRVKQLARSLQDFAEDVGQALRQITNMAGEDAIQRWSGKSAKKFKEQFDGVPGNLKKLRTSYDMAGDAFADYWPKLERAQSLADRALKKGREARDDLKAAQGRLDGANDWVKTATSKTKAYEDAKGAEAPDESKVRAATRNAQQANSAQSDAQGAVDSAQSALDAAKAMAEEARGLREDAARVCKDKLDDASDAGIQNRSWWEDAVNFVTENWDAIVAVCKVVVAVVGVIAMIVGGPILAAIVVVAALVVLADTLHKYSKGEASLFDVGMAALDCIPGMKGLTTLGGLAKGVKALGKTGLKGSSLGVKGLAKNVRKLGRDEKSLVCRTDPIDMATGEMVTSATDVELPGVLPLVLQRHHRSSVRNGRWFGPSWASTLDQRLLLDETGLRFFTEDGMELHYPVPEPDLSVLPVEGPRWPLTWDGTTQGTLTIHRPDTGKTLAFRPQPNRPAHELALTEIRDRRGNTIAVHYQPDGTPGEIIHHGGYRIGVTTDSDRISALTLLSAPDQPTLMRYAYDTRGNLTEVYNSADRPLTFTYDEVGRITGWQDRNDLWYRYTYENGRCIATEGTDGFLNSSIVYDTENRRTLFTDALGNTTIYEFNDSYQLIREQDPLGNETLRTHDRYDRLLSVTDALGHTTRYERDSADNLTAVLLPDGSRATAVYNELNLPTLNTEPGGATWQCTYDLAGNRLSVIDPIGAETTYAYDATGGLSSVTDALNNTQRIESNAAGLTLAVSDSDGNTTRVTRDAFGRQSSFTDALGNATHFSWTTEGKLTQRQHPDGARESWSWDGEGNLLSHTNSAGATTSYTYTHFDLVASRTEADGNTFQFSYDTELRLTQVTNPADFTWTYTYNAAGQLVTETDFNERTLTYTYDSAGRLSTRANGLGETTAFQRDALGRLTARTSPQGATATFAYSPSGALARSTSPGAEVVRTHDIAGRLLSESINGRTVTFSYDILGRRTSRTTPSGHTSTWTWDAGERPSALTTSAGQHIDFGYDATGKEIHRQLGDEALFLQTYDAGGRLASQSLHARTADTPLLHEHTYAYREDGHVIGQHDSSTGTRRYELTPTGRISQVHGANWTETYAYDSTGNITADNEGPREITGTLLHRTRRTHYTYDSQGRLTRRTRRLLNGQKRTWLYSWDSDDRLTAVRTPNGERWIYNYDAAGRRIMKSRLDDDGVVAEQTHFIWDNTCLTEQQSLDGTTLTWDYALGTHSPLAQTERTASKALDSDDVDTRFWSIITDLVGTPTQLLDDTGTITWHQQTLLWGSPTPDSAANSPCPLQFPGQYADPETGLHYNNQRYYDPETARYISPDPLGLEAGTHHHGYVVSPLSMFDPLGLKCVPDPMLDDMSEAYVRSKHMPGGSQVDSSKSLFKPDEDLDELVAASANSPARGPNGRGFYERDVDAGRDIGQLSQDAGGLPTTRYRVVQDEYGGVITMHPIP